MFNCEETSRINCLCYKITSFILISTDSNIKYCLAQHICVNSRTCTEPAEVLVAKKTTIFFFVPSFAKFLNVIKKKKIYIFANSNQGH